MSCTIFWNVILLRELAFFFGVYGLWFRKTSVSLNISISLLMACLCTGVIFKVFCYYSFINNHQVQMHVFSFVFLPGNCQSPWQFPIQVGPVLQPLSGLVNIETSGMSLLKYHKPRPRVMLASHSCVVTVKLNSDPEKKRRKSQLLLMSKFVMILIGFEHLMLAENY